MENLTFKETGFFQNKNEDFLLDYCKTVLKGYDVEVLPKNGKVYYISNKNPYKFRWMKENSICLFFNIEVQSEFRYTELDWDEASKDDIKQIEIPKNSRFMFKGTKNHCLTPHGNCVLVKYLI